MAQNQPDASQRLGQLGISALQGLFGSRFSGVFSSYRPIGSELDPGPLAERLVSQGWTLTLPVTPPADGPETLKFYAWTQGEVLQAGSLGIEEPAAHTQALWPDLILVPLLAFNRQGGRLGYGKGHFDRTLAMLRQDRQVKAVGLAYAEQEVAQLPLEPHDQPLDAILTEREFIQVIRG